MNIRKFLVGAAVGALMLGAMVIPALATSPSTTELTTKSWRAFNIDNSVPKLWEIDKAEALSPDGVWFPFQTSTTAGAWNGTGWFTAYFKTNYSVDLTGKIITANIEVVAEPDTKFWTRSTACANTGIDAYVRLEFQSATGNYTPGDYWWSTGTNSLNLSTIANNGLTELSFSTTADPSKWSNIAGQNASWTEPYTYDGVEYGSPAEEFENALKNVKEIGVAFGSACRYASGVNVSGGEASFQLNSFIVE